MKFGKKLAAEAARLWTEHYLDYKAVKKGLKEDVLQSGAAGLRFEAVLLQQLTKVSTFYVEKAEELEELLGSDSILSAADLSSAKVEIQELIKFVALNYLAVVKAIKKRNRHLKTAFGEDMVVPLHPVEILSHEVFFTSPRLAALATQVEVAAKETVAQRVSAADVLQDYQCPICLEVLRSPVVLTCAHRFCWGCLVAHFAALRNRAAACPDGTATADIMDDCSLVVLEKMVAACEDEQQQQSFYPCPCCRKPQVLNIESLQVDPHLTKFIEELKLTLKAPGQAQQQAASSCACGQCHSNQQPGCTALAAALPATEPVTPPTPQLSAGSSSLLFNSLLPPQLPQHQGKMTILLDLDGTLVSSFTPRRAPKLPASMRTHIVGRGSQLNPGGVFVVERPGLQEFLAELNSFAEVVIFTAGLEDYARPIIEAIDPSGAVFSACIFREGTVRTEHYQCVKDMQDLGRDLRHCVLVDDTPLAFLHQPCNGVPVLGFRGDPDDRLLMEAVLPLLQTLASAQDVRTVLDKRFEMTSWFRRHGYPVQHAVDKTVVKCKSVDSLQQLQPVHPTQSVQQAQPQQQLIAAARSRKHTLLLTDFDKTLMDFDAGERVFEELAPELLPMLVSLESPSNFIPVTNNLLAELQRRGVSRDKLLTTLQRAGQDMPPATVKMLKHLSRKQVDVKVISDCNSVFINHMLTGARVQSFVSEVLTNMAGFERAADAMDSAAADPILGASMQRSSSQRLVISPRHCGGQAPHGCKLCPDNFCKGCEVRRIKAAQIYRRVIYAGDGANDVCPALALAAGDVILARKGFALDKYLTAAAAPGSGLQEPQAEVRVWSCHEELLAQVQELVK